MSGDDRSFKMGGNARISNSQIALGDNVEQVQNTGGERGADGVHLAIARVAELLDRHADELADVRRARRDLDDIRDEVEDPDPDRDRMRDALDRLGSRVAAVVVVTEAVRELSAVLMGG
ncbi:DUF5955 family protein [Thermomonospora umbrina]|uniref:DUF5955 family protein n=1 Tax=Thermomonospora umbrina TaxID=111806 RepID=UPI000E25EE22|nr:DUF5955 family protein [Thermomonospora umbrina]